MLCAHIYIYTDTYVGMAVVIRTSIMEATTGLDWKVQVDIACELSLHEALA